MAILSCRSLPRSGDAPLLESRRVVRPIKETGRIGVERIDGDFKMLCESNRLGEAFECLGRQRNLFPAFYASSFALLVQACSREKFLEGGLQVHAQMIKKGFEFAQFVCTCLLDLYIRCGSLELARQMFDTCDVRKSLISWSHMISGYCRSGLLKEAFLLFSDMRAYGFKPDQFTFSAIFLVIDWHSELALGQQFQSLSVKFGFSEEEFVGNSLIQMYANCGRIEDSSWVFEQNLKTSSPVPWNSMMAILVENGLHERALELYQRMLRTGIEPTPPTFSSVLAACAGLQATIEGKQIHAQVFIRGFSQNTVLETAFVENYVKCGELEKGRMVFENMNAKSVVSWNTMIKAYSKMGSIQEALKLFKTMRAENILPDKFTFPGLLVEAASEEVVLEELKTLHAHIIKLRFENDPFVASSLITTYAAHHRSQDAKLAFEGADCTDVVLWSSFISACIKNHEADEAFWLFTKMLGMDIVPNQSIYSSLLMACAYLSKLDMGIQIHAYILKNNHPSDVATRNSLLTMYSNSGCIREAMKIFYSIENPNVISFNSMISAFAQHGLAMEAAKIFQQMLIVGLKPDETTFLALLLVFNHVGLTDEGLHLFHSMKEDYGFEPSYQHYACLVDMLARAGEIEEAVRYIHEMPFEPEPSLWRILLGACAKYRNIEIVRMVAALLLELEPDEVGTYVMLANTYASLGRWAEAVKVMHLMEDRGIQKDDAFSWIEINGRTHAFRAEDRSHPQTKEIYEKLEGLIREVKILGYLPDAICGS